MKIIQNNPLQNIELQQKVILLLLYDNDTRNHIDYMHKDIFQNESIQTIFLLIQRFLSKYLRVPTFAELESVIDKNNASDTIKAELKNIFKLDKKKVDLSYTKDNLLSFVKSKYFYKYLNDMVDKAQNTDIDEVDELYSDALRELMIIQNKSVDDDEFDLLKDLDNLENDEHINVIETPWQEINDVLNGGLGSGELGIVMAPPNRGKSWFLVAVGAKALQQGKNVVHITLELSKEYTAKRYIANITGVNPNLVHTEMNKVKKEMNKISGNLKIKRYKGQATVYAIYSYLEKLQSQGFRPDMIIIDYADLIKSTTKGEKRFQLEQIYVDLRSIAGEYDCPCWSASQTNRESANEDYTMGHRISEAWAKLMVVDFAIGFQHITDGKDTESKTGTFYIEKNRRGIAKKAYKIRFDSSLGIFEMNNEGNKYSKKDDTINNIIDEINKIKNVDF